MVITGMGLVSVFGNDVDAYYARLLAGESGVGAIDSFDASGFPTRFAAQIRGFSSEGYVDGKLDRRLDDIHRYALVASKKALESACLAAGSSAMEKVDKERAGVVVGSGMGGITAFSDGVENLVTKGYRKISPFCIPHAITNTSSAMIAMDAAVGFRGLAAAGRVGGALGLGFGTLFCTIVVATCISGNVEGRQQRQDELPRAAA